MRERGIESLTAKGFHKKNYVESEEVSTVYR